MPLERSRAPGGTGSAARGEPIGGPGADTRAAPRLCEHDAAPAQLGEAGGDGDRAEPDLGGEAPHGWQRLAGGERAAGDAGLDAVDQLGGAA